MKSLSVGNVVSGGLRIYRDHFKDYFKLAFIGYLWVLIPVYGWAKLAATMGLISRLFIVELPLGIEENINATEAISRSWELTKNSVFRIQSVVFIAFLISLPITIVVQIASFILQAILGSIYPSDSGIFGLLYGISILAITIGSSALTVPFWQSIKAVIYYDLRMRREGLGMEIRDKG